MRIAVQAPSGLHFVTDVEAGLEETGRSLLAELAERTGQRAPGPVPERLAHDWYIVELRRTANEVLVCEPDYARGGRGYVASVSATSAICGAQRRLHAALSAPRAPVRYDQGVVLEPGALEHDGVLATRAEAARSDDTGWRLIRDARGAPPSRWEALRVYELAGRRPIVVAGLLLPVGWSFKVAGEAIEEVAAPVGAKTRVDVALRPQP